MMLETSKKVYTLTLGTLWAGMKITPNRPFLAPVAPNGGLITLRKSKWGQNENYTSRTTHHDATNIKKGGYIDT